MPINDESYVINQEKARRRVENIPSIEGALARISLGGVARGVNALGERGANMQAEGTDALANILGKKQTQPLVAAAAAQPAAVAPAQQTPVPAKQNPAAPAAAQPNALSVPEGTLSSLKTPKALRNPNANFGDNFTVSSDQSLFTSLPGSSSQSLAKPDYDVVVGLNGKAQMVPKREDTRGTPVLSVGGESDPVFGAGSEKFQLKQLLKSQISGLSSTDRRTRGAARAFLKNASANNLLASAFTNADDLAAKKVGLEGQRVGFEGDRVGLEGQRVGLDTQRLGLEALTSDLTRRTGEFGLSEAERQAKIDSELFNEGTPDARRKFLLGALRAKSGKGGSLQFEKLRGGVDQFGNASEDVGVVFDEDTGVAKRVDLGPSITVEGAKDALAKGAPKDKVNERLRKAGLPEIE